MREQALRALSEEGVDLPAHIPVWRVWADSVLVYLAPVFYLVLLVQIGGLLYEHLAGESTLSTNIERQAFLAISPLVVIATVAYYRAFRPIHVLSPRQLRMAGVGGTNALQSLSTSSHPPILYLRSFDFDEQASAVSRWGELSESIGGGLVQDDTEEMKVVRALRRFGPVVAIGRPGEPSAPPGALRFYVRDDLWQSRITRIAPACQLVVLATGDSEGLQWEIRHMVDTLPPRKLLLWPHVNVGRRPEDERRRHWERLAAVIGPFFARPLPSWESVKRARFIVFDDGWAPICIPSEAFRPSLLDRLTQRPGVYGLRAYLRDQRARDLGA